MNEVKKSLQTLAGDVSKDREEVKQRVLFGERKPKSRNPFPLVATAIVLAAMLFITFNVLQNESSNTHTTYVVDEKLYDLLLKRAQSGQEPNEKLRYEVLQSMVEVESFIDYATSLGYTQDTEAIEKSILTQQQVFFSDFSEEQLSAVKQSQIDNFGYPYEDYFQVLLKFTERYTTAYLWLENENIVTEATQRTVLDSFKRENQSIISDFMKQKSIPNLEEEFRSIKDNGTVAYKDDKKVLLVQGLEQEEIEGKSVEQLTASAYHFTWFEFDQPIDDIKLYMQIEVTFDPLSYPIKPTNEANVFQDVIKWIVI